ncbi:hypothetical protein [Bradyrhizobium diazoefficiens]|jgi:hypothetical protein|uniref:hypothetical protein n=1 Tax=Bradyrhizobium diazoefficiens TaxID=1355477 RepID=UPI0027144FD5|nr:hypothetical protein [Bradyrhizobium diazoefficiens]WLB34839.1 hypothetical protein QIH78_25495 [Bradyrhizobium diazoefficiens]BCF44572.1 hypothetical protein XF16B_50620 [Bradyrhizobium diazoefficiens]BCF70718.1 hypothetical protein XF19B_50710 [Bradyrhizobium diazoefficiens]
MFFLLCPLRPISQLGGQNKTRTQTPCLIAMQFALKVVNKSRALLKQAFVGGDAAPAIHLDVAEE